MLSYAEARRINKIERPSGQDCLAAGETSFLEEGIIDSTGILELVTYLEDEYSITVEDEELVPENLDSISNVASYLERKI